MKAPPAFVGSGNGEARWWGESLAVIKAGGAETAGQLTVVEVAEPAGAEAPLHVHHREDEAFWVLDGEVVFEVGGTEYPARAGDYAFGPRGIPHRYRVGEDGCRLLFILTPGGFDELVRAMSVPAREHRLPEPGEQSFPDPEAMRRIAAANGNEILDG